MVYRIRYVRTNIATSGERVHPATAPVSNAYIPKRIICFIATKTLGTPSDNVPEPLAPGIVRLIAKNPACLVDRQKRIELAKLPRDRHLRERLGHQRSA